MTHNAGCAVLFNKDTFFPDVKVTSMYFHVNRHELPDEVREGETNWVMQGVSGRASFRRPPPSGRKSFTVVSLHINNNKAKKRGIGKKLLSVIRAVMLDEKARGAVCLGRQFCSTLSFKSRKKKAVRGPQQLPPHDDRQTTTRQRQLVKRFFTKQVQTDIRKFTW